MEFKLNRGFFRRKVVFNFDLTALKAATIAARMDLGEFYTSPKLSDDDRLFFNAFGAWLNHKSVTTKRLKRFAKLWGGLNVKELNQVKSFKAQSEIVSEHFLQAVKETAGEKKNY
jgi:hypothetical protein